jgi:hypothetical protein
MTDRSKIIDLTTQQGVREAESLLDQLATFADKQLPMSVPIIMWPAAIAAGVFLPGASVVLGAAALGTAAVVLSGAKLFGKSKVATEKQAALAEKVIRAAKENGARDLKFKVNRQAGLDLGATVHDVPIKSTIGSSDEMYIEVTFK